MCDIADQEDVPMEIVHEKVQEIVLRIFSRKHMQIACTNLKRLVLEWGLSDDPYRYDECLVFTTLVCPQLQCLELSGYVNMLPEIPHILLVLPSLTTLKCGFVFESAEDEDEGPEYWKDVVLQHHNLRRIILSQHIEDGIDPVFEVKMLVLDMPSLEVVDSSMRVRVMKEKENAN